MESGALAIEVKNLSKRYDQTKQALTNLTFSVPEGAVCCLLGPNGSGKTTLLKILSGLLLPTQGSCSLVGIDVQENPRRAKSHMGFLPADEKYGFYGRLTGRDNLTFFAALRGLTGKPLKRALGNVSLLLDLQNELDLPTQKLSAGNRQRVGLARVLLHDPNVLLLDEPFRNLDPHSAIRLRRLLRDHLGKARKKTTLLTTHQLDEAAKVADMVVIMNKGNVISVLEGNELRETLKKKTLEEVYLRLFKDVQLS